MIKIRGFFSKVLFSNLFIPEHADKLPQWVLLADGKPVDDKGNILDCDLKLTSIPVCEMGIEKPEFRVWDDFNEEYICDDEFIIWNGKVYDIVNGLIKADKPDNWVMLEMKINDTWKAIKL